MKKIIVTMILIFNIFGLCGCSKNDSSINIDYMLNELEKETNELYDSLSNDYSDITKNNAKIEYYNWKNIWNIEFMDKYNYVDNLSSNIKIVHNKEICLINIKYIYYETSYRILYTLQIEKNNIESKDELNINLNNFQKAIDTLIEKSYISNESLFKFQTDLNSSKLVEKVEKNKIKKEQNNYYEYSTYYSNLNTTFNYYIEQNSNNYMYNCKYSLINNYKIIFAWEL